MLIYVFFMGNLALGIYVHVPFCVNACAYCHFLKMQPTEERLRCYFNTLRYEHDCWEPLLAERSIETLFWGGGSPSCLSAKQMETLAVLCFSDKVEKEWTVEVSPASITKEKLQVLKLLGVTRISMGVQSFNEQILRQLGRRQSLEQVLQAYEWIRSVGFDNVNLDLIFPPDFSSLKIWQNDLKQALTLSPEHVSTYCLTYENDRGSFTEEAYSHVDVDKEADFYEFTWEFLQNKGYRHYEVSNFAKPGFECLHNLNTWRMQEWIGLGPSAASQWNHKRFQNAFNLDDWAQHQRMNEESLSNEDLCKDALIFGLRMRQGVNLKHLQKRFPDVNLADYEPLWNDFQKAGLITYDQQNVACTTSGLLLADRLALEIL